MNTFTKHLLVNNKEYFGTCLFIVFSYHAILNNPVIQKHQEKQKVIIFYKTMLQNSYFEVEPPRCYVFYGPTNLVKIAPFIGFSEAHFYRMAL